MNTNFDNPIHCSLSRGFWSGLLAVVLFRNDWASSRADGLYAARGGRQVKSAAAFVVGFLDMSFTLSIETSPFTALSPRLPAMQIKADKVESTLSAAVGVGKTIDEYFKTGSAEVEAGEDDNNFDLSQRVGRSDLLSLLLSHAAFLVLFLPILQCALSQRQR